VPPSRKPLNIRRRFSGFATVFYEGGSFHFLPSSWSSAIFVAILL
jgi:hypothetical protein